jgi:hypothetical protein
MEQRKYYCTLTSQQSRPVRTTVEATSIENAVYDAGAKILGPRNDGMRRVWHIDAVDAGFPEDAAVYRHGEFLVHAHTDPVRAGW